MQQQPVTEGYQYSQLSPSRSPSGPTYTQLSSGARTPATQQYHAVTTVPNNPGKFSNIHILSYHIYKTFHCAKLHTIKMVLFFLLGMWGWQQQHQTPQPDGQTNAQVAAQPPHPGQAGPGTQPQELSDMLQMLQDQGGSSGFEELNMFNTNFE